MRLAYFDAGAGVSGDMMLGALVDAGWGMDGLRQALAGLDLTGYALSAEETRRGGFRACRILVEITEEHGAEHGRKLADILRIIERSRLAPAVKERASRVFRRLAEAEARAHGAAVAEIHLHEAGAIDAMVDVVGSVAGLAALGVDRVVFSPLRLGYGTIRCAHGLLPVPAPAVAELVKGVPVYAGEIEGEMVTPTGAALAVTLADSFGPLPPMAPMAVGLGAGAADRVLPNLLRLFLGREEGGGGEHLAEVGLLQANLDDMNPENYDYLAARLWAAGALDVWLTPIQMKKGRPGTMLGVMAEPARLDELRELIYAESTTLGVREQRMMRSALARETINVLVRGIAVAVKIGRRGGRIMQVAPEYEDCRQAAARLAVPLKLVQHLAAAEAWAKLAGTGGDNADA